MPALDTPTSLDLFKLAEHDPTLRRHLDAWHSGAFVTFDDMLISLVCELAEEKAALREHIRKIALLKRR